MKGCPDHDQLLDGELEALEHAASCGSCGAFVDLVHTFRVGLQPSVLVPDHLIQTTLGRLSEERVRRGRWGVIVTFLLGTITALPIVLAGASEMSQVPADPVILFLLVTATAVASTVLEPKLVKRF